MPLKVDILLVSVTEVETSSLLEAFQAFTGAKHRVRQIGDRSYFDLGEIHGNVVWLGQCEMGSGGIGGAQQNITKALESLEPRAVVMVGIAFGVDQGKQAIGDILVSQRLTLYEQRRIGAKVILRGDRTTASPFLLSRVRAAVHSWTGPIVRCGLILTGEKLVDDLNYRTELIGFEPDSIGGEMEGAGLYVACESAKVDWILIKAICDWGDGNKGMNKEANQKLAAVNAARFALHALTIEPLFDPGDSSRVGGPMVAHLYWLGSDMADAFRHVKDQEPTEIAARCLTQARRHLRKAGLRMPAIEDRMSELARIISEAKPNEWADPHFRLQLVREIANVKGQINVFVQAVAGNGFEPWAD